MAQHCREVHCPSKPVRGGQQGSLPTITSHDPRTIVRDSKTSSLLPSPVYPSISRPQFLHPSPSRSSRPPPSSAWMTTEAFTRPFVFSTGRWSQCSRYLNVIILPSAPAPRLTTNPRILGQRTRLLSRAFSLHSSHCTPSRCSANAAPVSCPTAQPVLSQKALLVPPRTPTPLPRMSQSLASEGLRGGDALGGTTGKSGDALASQSNYFPLEKTCPKYSFASHSLP